VEFLFPVPRSRFPFYSRFPIPDSRILRNVRSPAGSDALIAVARPARTENSSIT